MSMDVREISCYVDMGFGGNPASLQNIFNIFTFIFMHVSDIIMQNDTES